MNFVFQNPRVPPSPRALGSGRYFCSAKGAAPYQPRAAPQDASSENRGLKARSILKTIRPGLQPFNLFRTPRTCGGATGWYKIAPLALNTYAV